MGSAMYSFATLLCVVAATARSASAGAVASDGAHSAPFTLSNTIGSSMVLQRGSPQSSLWGFAAPGATVSTTFVGCSGCPPVPDATTGADGVWRAAVPPLAATAVPFNVSFSTAGSAPLLLTDVLVGDVLLCSGQSNQQLSIAMALNATAEIAALPAYGATVRIFYAAGNAAGAPQVDLPRPAMAWARLGSGAGAASWGGFSATCWYTGRSLWASLGGGAVPVGLVEAAVGGTAVRNWVPTEALAMCPQPYNSPIPYGTGPYAHAELFNGMIAPFSTGPTAFRAIVWDQAESDSYPQTPLGYYGCQTAAMVPAWRAALGAPALPFVFLHLQPYTGAAGLEDLRAAQLVALAHPATGVASAVDLGDPASPFGNVHFRNKQVAGDRLATALRFLGGDAAAAAVYPCVKTHRVPTLPVRTVTLTLTPPPLPLKLSDRPLFCPKWPTTQLTALPWWTLHFSAQARRVMRPRCPSHSSPRPLAPAAPTAPPSKCWGRMAPCTTRRRRWRARAAWASASPPPRCPRACTPWGAPTRGRSGPWPPFTARAGSPCFPGGRRSRWQGRPARRPL